jgi:hypothetical protein
MPSPGRHPISEYWNYPELEWSEAEWESAWDASIEQAREYGWPEDAIADILLANRGSLTERRESINRVWQLLDEGNLREAFFESKRTRLREPGPPEWYDEIHGGRDRDERDA